MAKRDKLYTVNKWNRPFFELERRKKLYPNGGPIWGLNENQSGRLWGYGNQNYSAPLAVSDLTRQNSIDRSVNNFANYSGMYNPNYWQDSVKVFNTTPTEPLIGPGNTNTSTNTEKQSTWEDILNTAENAFDTVVSLRNIGATPSTPKIPDSYIKFKDSLQKYIKPTLAPAATGLTDSVVPAFDKSVYNGVTSATKLSDLTNNVLSNALTAKNLANNTTTALTSQATKDAIKASSQKLAEQLGTSAGSSGGPGFFSSGVGQAGLLAGMQIAGGLGRKAISGELQDTTPGKIGSGIRSIGYIAAPFAGPWAPLVAGIGETIALGLDQFGSVYHDNGITPYTNWLRGLKVGGSDEYLANLKNTVGPKKDLAYAKTGLFASHNNERKAERNNELMYDTVDRVYRNIDEAFARNNFDRYQNALSDYYNPTNILSAMGGKINRKKCNCKAGGGFLNNAFIDTASPSGYDIAMTSLGLQTLKNQASQDMGTSMGNTFMNTGSLFAKGGIMINPENRGKLTRLKKRTGKTEAELYSDGNPEHKKMVVFARNSRRWNKHALGGKINYGKDQDIRNNSFLSGQTIYDLGGVLQASGSNWGNAMEINAGGRHEENPYQGILVGVDPDGTPNLVEENEVIWNDYVFSNRLIVPKEVCKALRIGQKKNGYTFADAAKKLLAESKERPNDPISKRGLDANMQKLEDAQEELKKKMEADEAVEQFNSLPPEQLVAIMQQEGEKAQDAVAQEQMAQQIQNLPPEQQQAIAQQMAMEQAQQQGMPQQGMSPEEQYAMQQQAVQDQYAAQRDARNQEILAQAAAMQDQAINSSAMGGKLYQTGGKKYIKGAKSHWETNAQGHKVLVPNTPFENTGFGGGRFSMAGGGAEWGDEPAPLAPKKRDWLAIDYKESFNDAYRKARKEKKKTFWFDGKEYSTDYNPNLTEEQVRQGMNRYLDKGLIIAPWEHAYGGPLCFGGKVFAEGGELNAQPQVEPGVTQQPTDTEMAKYSDEELQDMINDYQDAESGEVKVTKGKLARLRKKAEKAQAELERRHAEENEEQPQEARQEPSQEELQAAAMAQAQAAQQPIEGQPQEGMPQEGMSPEQAMMMQQQMAGQMGQGSPEEMAAMEQQGQYGCGGRLYLTGGQLLNMFGFPTISAAEKAGWTPEDFGITSWFDTIDNSVVNNIISNGTARWLDPKFVNENTIPNEDYRLAFNNYNYNPFSPVKTPDNYTWYEPGDGDQATYSRPHFTNNGSWQLFYGENPTRNTIVNESVYKALTAAYKSLNGLKLRDNLTLGELDDYMKNSADWKARQDWLWTHQDAAEHRLKYLADIARNNEDNKGKLKGADKFSALNIYDFRKLKDGTYEVSLKQGKNANDERTWWDAVTSDLKYGDMYNAPHVPDTRNVYIDRDTGEVLTAEPGKDSGYTLVGNPLSSYVAATTDNPDDYNQTIRFYSKKGNGNNGNSNSNNPDFSELEPIRNDADVDWSGLGFAAAGPLMGLSLQYAMGKPDMSELDKAVAAYERNTGTMIAPHLTHGLIRPAIIDPRVVSNSMNQSRLGTNRLLMNTGASPSRGATILANDANSINQLGQAMIENWKANRAQEQAAATFNRETNTTNANILNQVDQFNAQTQASLANTAAQMRYNAAKEALDQNNAWKAGLIQNIGGLGKGIYDYWKDQQNVKQRDMLAELLFPMNDDWARQHHISYVDPVTGLVRRGENKGKYYVETADGKRQYLPYATINGINGGTGITLSLGKKSNGGKLKKKRKGYTF